MSRSIAIASVCFVALLAMAGTAIAQGAESTQLHRDRHIQGDDTPVEPPATHGGPIEGDDTPLGSPGGEGGDPVPPNDPTPGHGDGNGGNGGNGGSGGISPAADTVPTGDASCFYFQGWEMDGEILDGAYLTNTGDTVIKSGSIVYFTMGGQTVSMTVQFDVVPGGTWGYFVGNYSYQPLVFPAGTNLPQGGDCDIQISFA